MVILVTFSYFDIITVGEQDKPAVEHHIQADGGDYIVEPKSVHMSNGCALPGNRITITSNPLADTDKVRYSNLFFFSYFLILPN